MSMRCWSLAAALREACDPALMHLRSCILGCFAERMTKNTVGRGQELGNQYLLCYR
jgi:hypothetical protein